MREDERDRLLREKLEVLILARLSVGARPGSRARVSKALHALLARRFSAAEWREHYERALNALCAARLVEPRTLALTGAGRAKLVAALGMTVLPRAASWKEFEAKYLPRLFFREFFAGRSRPPLDPRAALLAERLGIVLSGPRRDRQAVIEAWLARELAIDGPINLETVAAALLGRELGLRPGQTRSAILRQSALVLAGATKDSIGAVSAALAVRWLFGERASRPSAANGGGGHRRATGDGTADGDALRAPGARTPTARALDIAFLSRAAAKIERAARGPRARSFGPNKVFIASVWESLAADPELMGLGEGGFKALLVEAHRRGLVDLSRADLVAAMDPGDVAASETRHQNATYHFIVRGASA